MAEGSDGRRRAGAATRRLLLDAASEALADGGPGTLSLRKVTAAAGANIAAINYHFGSRDALIAEVVQHASEAVTRQQRESLTMLAARRDPPAAREWIEAWGRPLVHAATAPTPDERRLGRIIGHALADPGAGNLGASVRGVMVATDNLLIDGLAVAVPRVSAPDLRLRLALMAGAVAALASGSVEPLLERADAQRDLEARILDRLVALATA